jgi:hypothetical protein
MNGVKQLSLQLPLALLLGLGLLLRRGRN